VLNKFIYDGVNSKSGTFQFISTKGDTTVPATYTDYRIIGNLDPKFYGGLRNTLTYKGFQLDFFLQFTKQLGANYLQQVYNGNPVGSRFSNLPIALLNRWQKPGDDANIQRFTTSSFGIPASDAASTFINSSGVYSDASFIRFKTFSFSYTFDNNYLKKLKIEQCRIYMNAQNLFTVTNYQGNDPETQSFYSLPPLKTLVLGLQLTL
jgi:hypothetical protein